jgi:hypothetical protein
MEQQQDNFPIPEYNYFDQRSQWLQQRCGRFTSSDIFKIMNKGRAKEKYFSDAGLTYIDQKAGELLTGLPINSTIESAKAIEWGITYEAEAIMKYEEKYNVKVEAYGRANPRFFPFGQYSGGSPDALIGAFTGLEIKCPYNSGEHIAHLKIHTPLELFEYSPQKYYQCIANALFTDRDVWLFSSYDPRFAPEYESSLLLIEISNTDKDAMRQRIQAAEEELKSIIKKLQDHYGQIQTF